MRVYKIISTPKYSEVSDVHSASYYMDTGPLSLEIHRHKREVDLTSMWCLS